MEEEEKPKKKYVKSRVQEAKEKRRAEGFYEVAPDVRKCIRPVKAYQLQRNAPVSNYMKYWKIVRYWAIRKFEVSPIDLDMLLFLYSETTFTKTDFDRFNNMLSMFKMDRLNRMIESGHIQVWREKKGRESKLYEITYKTRNMCSIIYKKLNGVEPITECSRHNRLFDRKTNTCKDRIIASEIRKMNKDIKAAKLKLKNRQF